MRFQVLGVAAALALAAGCDKGPDKRADRNAPPQANATSGASTSTTPANIGQPSTMEEKKQGANPVQGQVDPKEAVQHKDFQQRGDGAGPKSAETAPKSGG